jgi:putative hydrolase of the HAD superfamily
MTRPGLRYPIVLFDWGDTVMCDDPGKSTPMVEWETLELIEGIEDVLTYLHASGRQIALATSADVSTETQIRAALARCGIDIYFARIYSFTNTGLKKGEAFYRHILHDLNIPATDALMVGDHLEKDVQVPNRLGMFSVWFNPLSAQADRSDLHISIHSMPELRKFFEALDATGSKT